MARTRRSFWTITLVSVAILAAIFYGTVEHYRVQIYQAAINLQIKQANMSKHHVQVGDFNIAYLESNGNDNKPVLLMVHGFSASKANWLALAVQLKDDFHMIALDLPGHGETTQLANKSYDLDRQVERLHAFMAALHKDRFAIIGNSMGGGISALYAATYPQQISHVILLDAAGITDVKSEYTKDVDAGINPLIVKSPKDFDYMLGFVMVHKPFMPWPLKQVSTEKLIQRAAINATIFSDLVGKHDYNFKDAITHITAPTLIGWGDHDRILAPGNAAIFKSLIPNAQIHMFKDVGHVPMMEVPKQCADVVRKFIQSSSQHAL